MSSYETGWTPHSIMLLHRSFSYFQVNSLDIFHSGYKSTVWACTLTHLSNVVRNFIVSGRMKPEEAVVATLSSLPDEVGDTVGTVLPSEASVSE